jgi:hypothetical protein
VNHKIKIYAAPRFLPGGGYRWYTGCRCGWEPGTGYPWPDGTVRFGRPNWDAAFALGVAHQRNADLKGKL